MLFSILLQLSPVFPSYINCSKPRADGDIQADNHIKESIQPSSQPDRQPVIHSKRRPARKGNDKDIGPDPKKQQTKHRNNKTQQETRNKKRNKKMPPSNPTTTSSAPSARGASSPLIRRYLLAYNAACLLGWATCTLRAALLLPLLAPSGHTPAIFTHVFHPLLTATQSLAFLEILHALVGIVRAPVFTTFLQVASRVLVVWGVMYAFQDRGSGKGGIVGGDYADPTGKGLRPGPGAKPGDWAFLGCLGAWGVTECIRYGFFALQMWGRTGVPRWLLWLR